MQVYASPHQHPLAPNIREIVTARTKESARIAVIGLKLGVNPLPQAPTCGLTKHCLRQKLINILAMPRDNTDTGSMWHM